MRHKIIPGNCKSLWNAVNAAYDNGTTSLPECMTLGGVGVDVHERSDCFTKHFEQKVKTITENVTVTGQVYNGYRKVFAHEEMFRSINEVDKCIRSVKHKNSEGYDRIPQIILVDGADHLLLPLSKLFEKI